MMRSFFLSSAIKRLTWCVAAVAAIFAFLSIVAVLAGYESWAIEDAAYRYWPTSDKAARCQRMYAEAKPFLEKLPCESDLNNEYGRLLCLVRKQELKELEGANTPEVVNTPVVKRYIDSDCPKDGWKLMPPSHPGHLIAYTWNRIDVKPALPPAAFLVLVALLFMLTDIARTLLLEPHIGWRRLTIVASAISAVIAPFLFADEEGYLDPQVWMIFVSLAALIGTAASILYGRRIFLWVYSGFNAEAQSGDHPNSPLHAVHASSPTGLESAATLIAPTTVESQEVRLGHGTLEGGTSSKSYCSSCQAETEHDGAYCSVCGRNPAAAALAIEAKRQTKKELNLNWLWWLLGLTAVALHFIFRPEQALKAGISGAVVAILLPLIWLALRKKK